MQIKKVELINFGNIKQFSKVFINPLLILSGDNGNGKSTVIKAIRLALFDSYDGVLSDYINWDAKEFFIEVQFTHKAIDYKTTVRYDGSTERKLEFNGETYTGDEAKKKLKEILDPPLLKAAMLSLEQETDVVTSRPAERRDHLKRIYNLDFKTTLTEIDAELKEHTLEVARLTTSIDGLKNKNYLEPPHPIAPFSEEDKKALEQAKTETEGMLDYLKRKDEESKNNYSRYSQLIQEQTSLQKSKDSERLLLDSQKEKLAKLPELETAEKSQLTLQLTSAQKEKQELDQKYENLTSAVKDNLREAQSVLPKRVAIFDEQKFLTSKSELSVIQSKLTSLKSATDVCPTCGQKINTPEHIARREEEIKSLTSQLGLKQKEVDALTEAKVQYDKTIEYNQKIKEHVSTLELQLSSLTVEQEKKTSTVNGVIQSITKDLSILSEKYEIQRQHQEELISSTEKNLTQIREQLEKVTKEAEEIKTALTTEDYASQIQLYTNKLNEQKASLQKYSDYVSQLAFYKNAMEKVDQQKKEDQLTLKGLEESLKTESSSVKDCEAVVKILKTDFPVYVISRVIRDLEDRMNKFLNKTYGGRYSVKIIDKGSSLHIVYGPKNQDVALSSGYEKSLFNLAFKIAISRVINNKCLVLDEADSAASPNNAKLFYSVLAQTVGPYFDQIILVSHKVEVREMLEEEYNAEDITFVHGVAI